MAFNVYLDSALDAVRDFDGCRGRARNNLQHRSIRAGALNALTLRCAFFLFFFSLHTLSVFGPRTQSRGLPLFFDRQACTHAHAVSLHVCIGSCLPGGGGSGTCNVTSLTRLPSCD